MGVGKLAAAGVLLLALCLLVGCASGGGTGEPQLNVTPTTLTFAAGETAKPFAVSNGGGGTLTWSVTDDRAWITVAPASGTGAGTVTVTVDRSGLPSGTQTGTVTVTSNGGTRTVTVQVTSAAASLRLTTELEARCQTLRATQQVLGNSTGGANPTRPANDGSGRGCFRVVLGAAGGSVGIREGVWTEGFRLRRPNGSASQAGRIQITSSGYPWDPGPEPTTGLAQATCQLRGVINIADPDPVPQPGPFTDMDLAGQINIVSDYDGDVMIPPLPELPEGQAYEFEVNGPPGTDIPPVIVDVTSMTGKINVVSGTDPTDTALRKYDVTDYWPMVPNTVYLYEDLLWGNQLQITVKQSLENSVPGTPSFTSYPHMLEWPSAGLMGWRWWSRDTSYGVALYAWSGQYYSGNTTWVVLMDGGLILPNDFTLGESAQYQVDAYIQQDAIITQAAASQAVPAGPLNVLYQVVDAGTAATLPTGTTTNQTLTIGFQTWAESDWPGGVYYPQVDYVTLAKGYGPVDWLQYIWNDRTGEMVSASMLHLISMSS